MMKVEIWSDFVCPFCYIGKRRFEAALEQFPHRGEVEVVYRSFELDPKAKRDLPGDIHDMLASKYGMSREKAMSMNFNVGEQAQSVGLTYHFDKMKPTNTFDAHRLAHFAGRYGKSAEMTERLLRAYFTEGEHIGHADTLIALAAELGLDRDEVAGMLASDEGKSEVRSDEQEANALGVRGVPFFVINRKYAISGAQSSQVFAETLDKVWSEDHPLVYVNGADDQSADGYCEDGVCGVPPTADNKD
jgi:predicted DsbA family dithiol-disulfide isomerase